MSFIVGINPGAQYSGSDFIAGKCPKPGTSGRDGSSREYTLCLVAASQNLTNGQVVTIDGNFAVTVAASNPTVSAGQALGVAITSVTASASAYIWVQRFGLAAAVSASASANPGVVLGMSGATAGMLDDGVTSASGVIAGIVFTATATSGFAPALLNYPHFQPD